jgi:hypothetical protein
MVFMIPQVRYFDGYRGRRDYLLMCAGEIGNDNDGQCGTGEQKVYNPYHTV